MKNKILNIMIIFSIIMNLFSPLSVFADGNDKLTFELMGVGQNVEVYYHDGYYDMSQWFEPDDEGIYNLSEQNSKVNFYFHIKNANMNKKYMTCINGNIHCMQLSSYSYDYNESIIYYSDSLYVGRETGRYDLKIDLYECVTDDCYNGEKVNLDSYTIKLYNPFDVSTNDGEIVIDYFKDSYGDDLEYDNRYSLYYQVYDDTSFKMKFHGQNVKDNVTYQIYFGNQYYYKKGRELKDGMELTFEGPLSYLNFGVYSTLSDESLDIYTSDFEESIGKYISFQQKERLEYSINYKKDTSYKNEYNQFAIEEYSKNNPLELQLKNIKADDKTNYELNLNIVSGYYGDGFEEWIEENVYEETFDISGADLKKGLKITLNDFVPEIKPGRVYMGYFFNLNIDGKEYSTYEAFKTAGILDGRIFYNEKDYSAFAFSQFGATDGNPDYLYTMGAINKNELNKNNNMYAYYLGTGFNNTTLYKYVLNHCDSVYLGGGLDHCTNPTEIKTGYILGDVLNNAGLLLEINKKYISNESSGYQGLNLAVYKESEMVHSFIFGYALTEGETITSFDIKTDNKTAFSPIQRNYYDNIPVYIVNKNTPVTATLGGINFVDDKDYIIKYYKKNISKDADFQYLLDEDEKYFIKEETVKGKDINEGKVTFSTTYASGEAIDIIGVSITDEENLYIWGSINIEYVNPSDFFNEAYRSKINNNLSLIRGILKNTTVKSFKNNANILANIYNNSTLLSDDDNIGTGMRAVIVDEYDRELYDMDLVVSGDVTGDGNISITDLVKVKQHVASVKELTGVYEQAADVTDTGSVGITDLVKIRRDVAGLEEIK